ncbi:MAG: amidohydrolase [Halieaceae bacterium]|jgi:amidohydrolase
MLKIILPLILTVLSASPAAAQTNVSQQVEQIYEDQLEDLFLWFHQNPELSFMEHKTAARLASELASLGYDVHTGVGGTGLVALLTNGEGPTVMLRADMDGLPVEEKSGLPYASTAKQKDWDGNEVFVMHACGHDVHITSLVGTARLMAENRDRWQGTLMLIGQPAEERVGGAAAMKRDNLWERFGQPDYALAFHVTSTVPTGKLVADLAPYSGADTVDVIIKGVGAHGASPHAGIDPVLLGSQIVVGLQSVVSRTLPPRRPGVITVGSFHAGTKHNIISDGAKLQLTVRSESREDRQLLLDGIRRVAINAGRGAGLTEDMLPEVVVYEDEGVPPTLNDPALLTQLRASWSSQLGDAIFHDKPRLGMGAEDFPYFTVDPYIPSVYFAVGGTPQEDFDRAARGGEPVASHHSPLFKIAPEPAVELGVEASVTALLELLKP